MKKITLIATGIFLSAGCVQIKSPENLISDTYRTGKEIVKDVRDAVIDSDEAVADSIKEAIVVIGNEETIAQAKKRCVISITSEVTDITNQRYEVLEENIKTDRTNVMVHCKVKFLD